MEKNSPVVGIICAPPAIRDTVTKNDKRAVVCWRPGFNRADKVPVLGVGTRNRGRVDVVASLHVRRRPAPRVARDAVAGLTGLRVQGNGNVGLRVNFEVDGIRVNHLAARNGDGCCAVVESQGLDRCRVDASHTGLAARGEGNRGGCDGQVAAAEGIADLNSQTLSTDGQVQCLA